jgi:hypothetical protein
MEKGSILTNSNYAGIVIMSSYYLETFPDFTDRVLSQILLAHATRYPLLQAQDVYKLLHQTTMGSEHAVRDAETARAWLERDSSDLRDGPVDPLFDLISPDKRIARIHLRPYLQTSRNLETLLEAFIRTANEYRGDKPRLENYLGHALQLAREGRLPVAAKQLETLVESLRQDGYPAVHHSRVYEEAYHPAYRVVAVEFFRND